MKMGSLFSRRQGRSMNIDICRDSPQNEEHVQPLELGGHARLAGDQRWPGRSHVRGHHQSSGPQAQMSDLMVELKAVDWHQLGVQLQVPFDKLDKIDEDYRRSERKLSEVLGYWLLNEHNPTWDKICDALKRIGGCRRLVRELRMKYCSLRTCYLRGKLACKLITPYCVLGVLYPASPVK